MDVSIQQGPAAEAAIHTEALVKHAPGRAGGVGAVREVDLMVVLDVRLIRGYD